MYVSNVSAAVDSAIGTVPSSGIGTQPYSGQANCIRYNFIGKWDGNTGGDYGFKGIYIYYPNSTTLLWNNSYGNNPADATRVTGTFNSHGHFGSSAGNPWLLADTTYWWRSSAFGYVASKITVKTISLATTFGSSTVNGATQSTIDVAVNWYPNTSESTATLTLYYKKVSDVNWTAWTTTSGAKSGYTVSAYSTTVTGLDPGTTYQFKVEVNRNTVDNKTATQSLSSLATSPNIPTVTTDPASTIGYQSAQLNATVDPNTVDSTLTFEWGTSSGVYTTTGVGSQVITGDGDTVGSHTLTGLTESTPYYYRAAVTYNLGAGNVTIYGSEQTFSTSSDPGANARAEDLMQTQYFDGQYGTATTIRFTLKTIATNGSDEYYDGAVPTGASQVEVVTDGVSQGQNDNEITKPTTKIYQIVLSAAEMSGEVIDVMIESGAASFRDAHLQIRTAQRLSELDLDCTNGPTDATALTAIGNGAGDGIKATGGATGQDINAVLESNWLRVGSARTQGSPDASFIRLDTASATTDDYYNGCLVAIIGGTGVGQARIAIDYTGGADAEVDGNREIEVDTPWIVTPDDDSIFALSPGPRVWEMKSPGELDEVPDVEGSYGEFIRLLFQRFTFRIEQDADYQTWFKADNSTEVFSRAVEDSGVLQRLYRLQNF